MSTYMCMLVCACCSDSEEVGVGARDSGCHDLPGDIGATARDWA